MPLHDYQEFGVKWLRSYDNAGLFMDMGLGKTATTLAALEPRHLPALVIAPKRVASDVWPVEQPKWRPDLALTVAQGDKDARRAALLDPAADVCVLGRDNVNDLLVRTRPWRTLVIDELSSFKGRGARWKTMRKVRAGSSIAHTWGLTGTPMPNGYLDLWAELALLDKGERLGKSFTRYKEAYFTPGRRLPNGTIIEWILNPGAAEAIKAKISDICLYMDADDHLDLPPVTENEIVVELPAPALREYRRLKEDMVANLEEFFGGEIHSAANAAVMTGKLSQLTSGFLYVDDADLRGMSYDWVHNEKIEAIKEVAEGTGSPILCYYLFRPELAALRKAFPQGVDITDKGYRQSDWDAGRIPIMFAHPASAGHGLNLQHGGHTIVWTSPPWDLELWDQGNGRLARQGQTRPVMIHVIMARGSIDYLARARCQGKANVQDDLLDFLRSPV